MFGVDLNELFEHTKRIADALERIADALEGKGRDDELDPGA